MRKQKDKSEPLLTSKAMESAGQSVSQYFRNELGQFLSGHPGQPKRYTNKEDLQNAIIRYFEHCEQTKKHLTMTGLALALGFRTRQALVNYEKETGYEFAHDIIQYAKLRIEEYTEQNLHNPKTNIVGAIFSLKNNWGWADKSEVKVDQRTVAFQGFEIEGLNEEPRTIEIKEDQAH